MQGKELQTMMFVQLYHVIELHLRIQTASTRRMSPEFEPALASIKSHDPRGTPPSPTPHPYLIPESLLLHLHIAPIAN
jgi:hypothetical protein